MLETYERLKQIYVHTQKENISKQRQENSEINKRNTQICKMKWSQTWKNKIARPITFTKFTITLSFF